jgi:hypothetical protein
MNKINLLIIGTIFLFLTISCSSIMKGKALGETAVEKFHNQINAKQFSEIYNQADDEFKKSVTEQQWSDLLNMVHRKLGTVTKSDQSGWNTNSTTAGTFATITCEVEFAEGKGTEQFVFHIIDDKALLYNYNVTSPLLIPK